MLESKIIIFIINLLIFSFPIALFEILFEKDKGWGGGLPKNKWYGAVIGLNNPLMKLLAYISGFPYFFGYAVLMYFFLLPGLFLLENFLYIHNFLFTLALYIGIIEIEDFFWFMFNWHFPALRELLKGPHGSIWWHKRWMKVFNGYYLPVSYLAIILVAILFFIS